jgi:hypothetical protein
LSWLFAIQLFSYLVRNLCHFRYPRSCLLEIDTKYKNNRVLLERGHPSALFLFVSDSSSILIASSCNFEYLPFRP